MARKELKLHALVVIQYKPLLLRMGAFLKQKFVGFNPKRLVITNSYENKRRSHNCAVFQFTRITLLKKGAYLPNFSDI